MTERLQRHGLAELRLLVGGIQLQAAVEAEQRGLGILLAQVADTEAEVRIHVAGIERAGAMERLGGVLPRAGAFQADRQIEPAHGVLRLHLGQDAVALCRLLEVAEFELDVPHGAVDLGRGFVRGNGTLQLFECLLALAGKVQGDRSRQVGLRSGVLLAAVDFVRAQALDLGGCSHGCGAHLF